VEQIKEAISNLLPQTGKMGAIQFIRQHRLESFVSARFEGGYTKELEIDLYNIKKLNEDKLAFLKRIHLRQGIKPLVIKGFTSFYLTGNTALLRKSKDMDVFAQEPSEFVRILVEDGFNEIKSPNPHEYSMLTKDSIEIDLHRHFPIASYPRDLGQRELNKELITNEPLQFVNYLDYDSIIHHTVELPDCLIPTVTMSALIACINIFNDYVTGFAKAPSMKLIEVIEVIELIRHQNFNRGVFVRLVNLYGTQDAVSFTNYITQELFGMELVYMDGLRTYSKYPQIFFWQFNTWFIPERIQDITVTDKLDHIFRVMDSSKAKVSCHARNVYSNKSMQYPLLGIEKNNGGESPEIEMDVLMKDILSVTLHVNTESDIDDDVIHIQIGKFRKTLTRNKFAYFSRDVVQYDRTERGYAVEFKISQEDIPDLMSKHYDHIILFFEHHLERHVSSNFYFIDIVYQS